MENSISCILVTLIVVGVVYLLITTTLDTFCASDNNIATTGVWKGPQYPYCFNKNESCANSLNTVSDTPCMANSRGYMCMDSAYAPNMTTMTDVYKNACGIKMCSKACSSGALDSQSVMVPLSQVGGNMPIGAIDGCTPYKGNMPCGTCRYGGKGLPIQSDLQRVNNASGIL